MTPIMLNNAPTTLISVDPRTGKPAVPPEPYKHQDFPRHVYFFDKENVDEKGKPKRNEHGDLVFQNRIVDSPEKLDELREESGHDWFMTPKEAVAGKHAPPPADPASVADAAEEKAAELELENDALKEQLSKLQAQLSDSGKKGK